MRPLRLLAATVGVFALLAVTFSAGLAVGRRTSFLSGVFSSQAVPPTTPPSTFSSPSAEVTPKATALHVIEPFTYSGKLAPGLKVGKEVSGSCWEGSLADPRSDAWRCLSGNIIEDPCFGNPSNLQTAIVVCIFQPTKPAVVIHLTRRLPFRNSNDGGPTKGLGTWLSLANGTPCGPPITGTAGPYGFMPCADGSYIQKMDKDGPVWTASVLTPGVGGSNPTVSQVAVNAAWG